MTDIKAVVVPKELYYHEVAYVRGLEADVERLRTEFKRFMDVCAEGSSRGRAIDLISKCDWERARTALESKP